MPERRQLDKTSNCCYDIGQRVAVLETNQKTLADALKETVAELKSITLKLAERRGVEKLSLFLAGGFLTTVGWLLEHAAAFIK